MSDAGAVLGGNLVDLVAAAAERGPDHPALVDPGRGVALSWSHVQAAADAEVARLRAAGVRPGERVLVRLAHGVPFCLALFGAVRAGAVAVPIGAGAPARELAAIVADCAPSVLVAEPGDAAVAEVAGGARVLGPPALDASAAAGADVSPAGAGEDIAVLGYTSGTTGVPRGVRLSHRALLANRAQIARLRPAPVSPADRVLLQLPLFHLFGLGAGLLQVCWSGATGVLVSGADPVELIDVIRAERVTVLAGVPSLYRSMLRLPAERLREELVTVRLCTTGGAPLAPELPTEFAEATGLELYEGYGLTETGPVLTSTLVGGRSKPGSVGRPLPGGSEVAGVELRLVDTDGSEDPDDEDSGDDEDWDTGQPDTGLVSVRGPNLFSGYWPDGAGGPDADGWFRTSDVGYLDADGDLHLVDRASDLVIVNGFNVYPHEVEQVLEEHPSVAEAAVIGIADPATGEAVKAVLVPRAGATLTEDEVRAHCAARLARFKVPSVVEFADVLPHSATGKITRVALREERR
ncbi:AMP-binding protein [Pseudonocardia acaciae]|uniref:AMP-binding protein n=1 Tax=Pseudonocardia acaciae TaxID=551276 RepID=UPI00048BC82A|nr:AMP-binding protein [Pseudonocardia acaciae]